MNEENVQRHISKSDIQNISNELLTICNSIFDEVKSIKNIINLLDSDDQKVINETLSVMKTEFDSITEMLGDTRLYVGVTGEFSSGKSTFLNALLEHDVLETDVNQGTTCAPTIIEYCDEPNVLVKYTDGTEVSLTDDRMIKFYTNLYKKINKSGIKILSNFFFKKSAFSDDISKKFITLFAANEDVSKNIASVNWSYPLNVLSDGLVVIDTPGIGTSANKRHTEVAEAVSKKCDALIVLFDLNKPLSNELINNVKSVTNGDPSNCVFIGTKADTIKKREVERLISFCKNKLHKSLNANVSFFAISPYVANEERVKSAKPNQKNDEPEKTNTDYGLNQFQEFRNQLFQILLRNRGIIQSKKLNKQITAFVTNMQNMLKDDINHFEIQIAEYNKNIIPTDSPLWEQWYKKAKLDFKNTSKEVKASMENGVDEIISNLKNKLFESINSCSDNTELKNFLESGVQSTVSGYEPKFSDYINKKIYKPLNDSANDILSKLDNEYKNNLKKIENIFNFVSGSAIGNNNRSSDNGSLISYSSGTRSLSEAFESEENKKIGGGLATGIAVSLMIPGAGWVAAGVLALVGGVIGAMFGPSLQERKTKSKEQILEYMEKIHDGFSQKVQEMYQEYQKDISAKLERSLKHKKESYLGLINSYNDNIQRIQRNFKISQEQIDRIVVSLNNYQNQINSVIGKLE